MEVVGYPVSNFGKLVADLRFLRASFCLYGLKSYVILASILYMNCPLL